MKQTTQEKLMKLADKKIILGSLALIMALGVICLCSFIPLIFKPENLFELKFITNVMILFAITLIAMVSAMFIGQASNSKHPQSELAQAKIAFKASIERIVSKRKFKQWIKKYLEPQDIKTIKQRMLTSVGLDNVKYLDLSIEEVKSLIDVKAGKVGDTLYLGITKEQAQMLIHIRTKGIHIKFVPPEYYLSVKGLLDARTRSERASSEQKKKVSTLTISVTSKLVLTFLGSAIFAMLARDVAEGGFNSADAWLQFLSRMLAFTTSIFMGFLVGCQINDIDAEYIQMRVSVHEDYLVDEPTFKEVSEEEEAKELFIERMRTEQMIPMGYTGDTHAITVTKD